LISKQFESLPLILTVDEAAQVARVSAGTMYTKVHSEGFPVIRFGRSIRIPTQAFLQWLQDQALS
jgi:excisionase family DNA binding protein